MSKELFENIKLNLYLTLLTEDFLNKYPDEVQELAFEFLTHVEFIKNLTSTKRKYAKDLPRDDKGRIIVDLENPHICENMDYFRLPALHYLKHKCYTFLKPNSNPHSEYRKFWQEELRRCREGYVRESDGEWVTGYCYWYLNYNPMLINIIKEGSKRADRIESMPLFFEGVYWRFHYLELSREAGKHSIELAKRGASKAHPYDTKVITPEGIKEWRDIQIGSILFDEKGGTTKVIDIPFDEECDIYELTLRDGRKIQASDQHLWEIEINGRKNKLIVTTKELLNIYKKKRKISYKNPLGTEYVCSIPKNKGVEFEYNNTKLDPYTFGLLLGDGCFRHKSCYFTLDTKDILEESKYIPYKIIKWNGYLQYRINIPNWVSILKEYGLWYKKSEDKFIPTEYLFNSKLVRLELLKGIMDSEGFINKKRNTYHITLSSLQLINDILFLCRSLGFNCSYTKQKAGYKNKNNYIQCKDCYCLNIYTNNIISKLQRKIKDNKIYSKYHDSRLNKTKIINIEYIGKKRAKCVTVDNPTHLYLIGDFITTHNSYTLSSIMTHNLEVGLNSVSTRRTTTVLTAYQKEYLKGDKDGTLSKFQPALSFILLNTPFPRLMLKESPNEMSWLMGYKDEFGRTKGSLNMVLGVSAKDDSGKLRGKRGIILFEEMGLFKNLDALYDVTRKSVEDGDYAFALMVLVGTASDSESDFSSAKKLLTAPDAHRIYSIRNVYDKPKQGSKRFGFFYPAYINRMGCFNKDGVSDVIKALFEILMARYNAKYNNADSQSLLRQIAEDPITPAEAIVKVKTSYFPTVQILERILLIDSNPRFFDKILTGELVLNKSGEVEFRPTAEPPIRLWNVDNTTKGCVEIFELPLKDSNGKIPSTRYILGADPYDNDLADSCSLYSIFVFDLFTDKIVAEYTGRTSYADDAHEIARKLCILYNGKILLESNKKGWFAYFSKMNSTKYLAETPLYLRDLQLIKYLAFGSNKYGVNVNAAINDYGRSLIRNWLVKPVTAELIDEDGNPYTVELPNLYTIWNRALLDELSNFDAVNNFDRISALVLVMLYREEKIIMYLGDMRKSILQEDDNYAGNDDFFKENYDDRINNKTKFW